MMEESKMSLEVDSAQRSSVGAQFYPLDNVFVSRRTVSQTHSTDFLSAYRKFLTDGVQPDSHTPNVINNDDRLPNTAQNCTDLKPANDEICNMEISTPVSEPTHVVCPNADMFDSVDNNRKPVDTTCEVEKSSNLIDGSETSLRTIQIKLKRLSSQTLDTLSSPQLESTQHNVSHSDYISRYKIRPSYVLLQRLPVDFSDLVKNYCKVVNSLSNNRNNSSLLENNKENEVHQSTDCTNECNEVSTSNKLPNVLSTHKHGLVEGISDEYQQIASKQKLSENCRKALFQRGSDSRIDKKAKFQYKLPCVSANLTTKQNDFDEGNQHEQIQPVKQKRPYNRKKNINDAKYLVNTNYNLSTNNTFQKRLRVKYPKRRTLETTSNDTEIEDFNTKREYNKNNTTQEGKRKYVKKKNIDNSTVYQQNHQFYGTPAKYPKLEAMTQHQMRTNCITRGIRKHDNVNLPYNRRCGDVSKMYTSSSMRKPTQLGDFPRFSCANTGMKKGGNKCFGYDGCDYDKCKNRSNYIQVYNNEDDTLHLYEHEPKISTYDHNYTKESQFRSYANERSTNGNERYCNTSATYQCQSKSKKLPGKQENKSMYTSTCVPASRDWNGRSCNSYNKSDYCRTSEDDTYAYVTEYPRKSTRTIKTSKNGFPFPITLPVKPKNVKRTTEKQIFQPLSLATLAVKTFLGM